ncbi:hypothetical protein [Acetobacter tropicalis]|uniref:hypothetical protein n=1 Tax=Acetobacter tropicalis TaxID=104102 RepID=UPI00159464E0|nr:hypothetical protein [Acetobacter tropicalis]
MTKSKPVKTTPKDVDELAFVRIVTLLPRQACFGLSPQEKPQTAENRHFLYIEV